MKRLAGLAASVVLIGCGGDGARPLDPASRQAQARAVARVKEWVDGQGARAMKERAVDAYLLRTSVNVDPSTISLSPDVCNDPRGCSKMTSFLPVPFPSNAIVATDGGRINVIEEIGGSCAMLSGGDDNLEVMRLLAFGAAASPLELLVTTVPRGGGQKKPPEEIHVLELGPRSPSDPTPGAIVGMMLATDHPSMRSKEAFFARFRLSRCGKNQKDCVYLQKNDVHISINIERTSSGPVEATLLDLTGLPVRGVSRVPGTTDEIYLLMACGEVTP